MRYFEIGRIINTHGTKGELKVFPTTDDPQRFELLDAVYIFDADGSTPPRLIKIEKVWYHKQCVMLKLAGIDDMSAAERLRNSLVKITEDCALPLAEDEYYYQDLYDMLVVTTDGKTLGTLTDIIQTGANDVYAVRCPDGREILLPAIKQCIVNVNITEKTMTVFEMDGLIQ